MKYTQGIYIDGELFDVPIISITRTFDVLDKYAERNEDNGELLREILGVYLNYTINFGYINDPSSYQALINKLTEPVEFHDFIMPNPSGTFSFTGYIAQVSDQYSRMYNNTTTFEGLTCSFVMKAPYRTP